HETKDLLIRALGEQVVFVDETDTAALLRAIDDCRPRAVLLDTLCNTKWMPRPDVSAVIRHLRLVGRPTYFVLDNTGLGPTCQPFATLGDASTPRLIVFES